MLSNVRCFAQDAAAVVADDDRYCTVGA